MGQMTVASRSSPWGWRCSSGCGVLLFLFFISERKKEKKGKGSKKNKIKIGGKNHAVLFLCFIFISCSIINNASMSKIQTLLFCSNYICPADVFVWRELQPSGLRHFKPLGHCEIMFCLLSAFPFWSVFSLPMIFFILYIYFFSAESTVSPVGRRNDARLEILLKACFSCLRGFTTKDLD